MSKDRFCMRKYLYFILCFLYVSIAQAEECNFIRTILDFTKTAENNKQEINGIVYYCPIEIQNDNVQILEGAAVSVELDMKRFLGQAIQYNSSGVAPKESIMSGQIMYKGKKLNPSCVYMPTENKKVYRNLVYMANCPEAKNTPMQEYLDIEKPFHIE